MWKYLALLILWASPAFAFHPCEATFRPDNAAQEVMVSHGRPTSETKALADQRHAEVQAKLETCVRDFNKSVKP